jgi:hypothetical protein
MLRGPLSKWSDQLMASKFSIIMKEAVQTAMLVSAVISRHVMADYRGELDKNHYLVRGHRRDTFYAL